MKSLDTTRRGFLRGLTTLPLIGGGVALIGQPTAAAVPVTDELLERYLSWLWAEAREVRIEMAGRAAPPGYPELLMRQTRTHLAHMFPAGAADIEAVAQATLPSTRAAVMLAAAGLSPIEVVA